MHRFAERYGWTPDTTLNLTDELRSGLLACMIADAPAKGPSPSDQQELLWTAEAVREIEAEREKLPPLAETFAHSWANH